eukprot:jgi/Chlat1/5530/Chrsp369S05344
MHGAADREAEAEVQLADVVVGEPSSRPPAGDGSPVNQGNQQLEGNGQKKESSSQQQQQQQKQKREEEEEEDIFQRRIPPRIKLEVISPRELNRLAWLLFLSVITAAGYCAFVIVISHHALATNGQEAPAAAYILGSAMRLTFFVLILVLFVIFTRRILLEDRSKRVPQQYWVMALLGGFTLCQNVPGVILIAANGWRLVDGTRKLAHVFTPFCQLTYYLYWMLLIRSYRVTEQRLAVAPYYRAVLVVLAYYTLRVGLEFGLDFNTSPFPFIYLIPAIRVTVAGTNERGHEAAAMILAVMDLSFFIVVCWSTHVTSQVLRKKPFDRVQELGYRFFLMSTVLLWASLMSLGAITLGLLPLDSFITPNGQFKNFEGPTYALEGLDIIVVFWLFSQAAIHLPADSVGWRGWFVGDPNWKWEALQEGFPSFSLRDSGCKRSNNPCFSLESAVRAFNFSMLAYFSLPTVKLTLKKAAERYRESYECVGEFHDPETDSSAFVCSSKKLIVIAFRGTASLANAKVDLRFRLTNLDLSAPYIPKRNYQAVATTAAPDIEQPVQRSRSTIERRLEQELQSLERGEMDEPEAIVRQTALVRSLSTPAAASNPAEAAERAGQALKPRRSAVAMVRGWLQGLANLLPLRFLKRGQAGQKTGEALSDQLYRKGVGPAGNIVQAVTELKNRAVGGGLIRVHSGFYYAWQRLAEQVFNCVYEQLEQNQRPILVTGHSLGAAEATLCAYDLRRIMQLQPSELFVYTFGSPRVGNPAFVRSYDKLVTWSFRIAHARDEVTYVPWRIFGFEHVDYLVLLERSHNLLLIQPTFAEVAVLHLLACGSVSRHMMGAYAKALKAWKQTAYPNDKWELPFWDIYKAQTENFGIPKQFDPDRKPHDDGADQRVGADSNKNNGDADDRQNHNGSVPGSASTGSYVSS